MKIYIATCRDLEKYFPSPNDPLFTHDDQVLVSSLREKGFGVYPFLWDEDSIDVFSSDDVLIIRSTWNYMDSDVSIAKFSNWLEELRKKQIRVMNEPSLMTWNFTKTYLKHFENHVPGVKTSWLTLMPSAVEWYENHGPFVLKPQQAAAAKHAYRARNRDEAENLEEIFKSFSKETKNCGWMLQPYVEGVETFGELSLIYFGGIYSHSVLKIPAKGDWRVQDELGGTVESVAPSERALQIAQSVINRLPQCPHYARVDLMKTSLDDYVLGEVEMIEPELFFLERCSDGVRPNTVAIDAFIAVILNRDFPE